MMYVDDTQKSDVQWSVRMVAEDLRVSKEEKYLSENTRVFQYCVSKDVLPQQYSHLQLRA